MTRLLGLALKLVEFLMVSTVRYSLCRIESSAFPEDLKLLKVEMPGRLGTLQIFNHMSMITKF